MHLRRPKIAPKFGIKIILRLICQLCNEALRSEITNDRAIGEVTEAFMSEVNEDMQQLGRQLKDLERKVDEVSV